jgi:glycosyltransferase involved in cell wall biosynthesis/SAM-dependent methyltransferase
MGDDLKFYAVKERVRDVKNKLEENITTAFTIIMVTHNALAMVQIATLRTLKYISDYDARLLIVENASTDGTAEWLAMLAERGDIKLIRNEKNIGHGPGIELARHSTCSPYLVTLDSDAFPLCEDWLKQLKARLVDPVKVSGILHYRNYIHPSCLLIAQETLQDFKLTFLNEKDQPSQFDVAERISAEIMRQGYQIAGLKQTNAQRRGSLSEPVYLGSEYEGVVYHQWYTTRAATSMGHPVDDVPTSAIEQSLHEVFEQYHSELRDVTVIVGIRVAPNEPQRLRNLKACLRSLNMQDLPRWRYRIVVVEQDDTAQLEVEVAPLVDRYIFAYNPGAYNRGWAFNIGAVHGHADGKNGLLCLLDADLLVPANFLNLGIKAIQDGARAVQPYKEVVYLNAQSSEEAISNQQMKPRQELPLQNYRGQRFNTSQGGCIWVDATLYREIGGHDERFRGWGYEDREFWNRLARVTSIKQLSMCLLHLDHPLPAMADKAALANQRLGKQLVASTTSISAYTMIGDIHRYKTESIPTITSSESTQVGRRKWENWHQWHVSRIEQIVREEMKLPVQTSARWCLAEIAAGLGDTLLDLGCGPGSMWLHLARHRPRLSWAGTDATPEMLRIAKNFFPEVPVYHADAASTPFDNASFDVVLMRHVLEHLPLALLPAVLKEATRLARKAIVIDFYIPPVPEGSRRTITNGENFLETCWAVPEISDSLSAEGWYISEQMNITSMPTERNEVWIVRPSLTQESVQDGQGRLKVSIVMPTYHRQHAILQTIATIKAQSYTNWELLIIDNAGDGAYSFADSRIHVFCHADYPSASYARNVGLAHATGDIVCFFDDDDDMFPNYLEHIVSAFQATPSAKMVRCGMLADGQLDYSYATPECILKRPYATPSWLNDGPAQDQNYFSRIVAENGWTEEKGDMIVLHEVLCRANANSSGGLRKGRY